MSSLCGDFGGIVDGSSVAEMEGKLETLEALRKDGGNKKEESEKEKDGEQGGKVDKEEETKKETGTVTPTPNKKKDGQPASTEVSSPAPPTTSSPTQPSSYITPEKKSSTQSSPATPAPVSAGDKTGSEYLDSYIEANPKTVQGRKAQREEEEKKAERRQEAQQWWLFVRDLKQAVSIPGFDETLSNNGACRRLLVHAVLRCGQAVDVVEAIPADSGDVKEPTVCLAAAVASTMERQGETEEKLKALHASPTLPGILRYVLWRVGEVSLPSLLVPTSVCS